jgi:hypothetical protein
MKAAGRVNNEKFPFKTMRKENVQQEFNIANRADFQNDEEGKQATELKYNNKN